MKRSRKSDLPTEFSIVGERSPRYSHSNRESDDHFQYNISRKPKELVEHNTTEEDELDDLNERISQESLNSNANAMPRQQMS